VNAGVPLVGFEQVAVKFVPTVPPVLEHTRNINGSKKKRR